MPHINTIAQRVMAISREKSPVVVAVCGAADLGKSFMAKRLVEAINHDGLSSGHLPLDSFLMERNRRIKQNISGYQPEAYDLKAIRKQVNLFKNGHKITFAPYSHSTGRFQDAKVTVEPGRVLIIEGLHSMHEILRPCINLSIFVYARDHFLREIRREADIIKRKQSIAFSKPLEPYEFQRYKQYVEPYRGASDIQLFLLSKWRYRVET